MGARKRIKLTLITFLFTTACIVHCQEPAVYIEPVDDKLSKPAMESLAVTCIGAAEKVELFDGMKWIGPKGEISQNEGGHIYSSFAEPGKLFLIFQQPNPEDSGTYNCSATYANTISKDDSVNIIFYHAITWDDCKEQQSVIVGQEGHIRCLVNANPAPTVTWYLDSVKLDPGRFTIRNDGIVIPDVKESDAGVYNARAMVESTGNLKWRRINVEVHVPPKITKLQENYSFVVGERAEMSCEATGVPTPRLYWFHEKTGRNLSEAEGYLVNTESGVVTIQSVRREDSGAFSCQSVNSAGTDAKSTTVAVIVKPEVKEFINKTAIKGQDTIMVCRVSGDPKPKITMRKDGNDRIFQNGDERIKLERKTEGDDEILIFTIQGVERSDDGLYYCTGQNDGGKAEQVGHLTVEYSPDMTNTPSVDVKTWKEHPVNLTCVAQAIPNATITWTHRGRPVENNELYRIYSGASVSSLLVKPSLNIPGGNEVYGVYRCDARNPLGNNSIEIKLTEARSPGLLQQNSIERHTATTVTFMLRGPKDDGGLPVKTFIVQYGERESRTATRDTREWPEGTSYILEKLKPRTAYLFQFAARNEAGTGPWSEETEFVMPAEAAPEIPNFIVPGGSNISRYSDSYIVRWNVPQDNGMPIDHFSLRYFEVAWESNEYRAVSKAETVKITDWEHGPRYTITGLKPDTWYRAELRANNEIGNSQPASTIFKTAKVSAGSTVEEQKLDEGSSNLTTAAIVAIIIVVVLVILGLLDATCYLRYNCGVFYCLRTAVCGRSVSSEKVKDGVVEDGGKGKGNRDIHDPNGRKHTEKDESEESPMIVGAKDTKANDASNEDLKNKSPKGSKSSIAKDSLV